jgi:hypothetical protein
METISPLYNAVVLTKESQYLLRYCFRDEDDFFNHPNYYGHHMTMAFKPEQAPENEGEEVEVKVIGYSKDDKGEAVVVEVEGVQTTNKHPHITLSCAKDVKPFYSNILLEERGYTKMTQPLILKGVVTAVYPD